MSRSLDYVGGLKRKAVAARSYRCSVSSKSGTEFGGNRSFQIEMPTIARSYADLANMCLEYDIISSGVKSTLCSSGYDVINRMTISSGGGAVIDDCQNLNLYYNAVLAQNVSHEFMRGYMAEAAGHRGEVGSPLGVDIPATRGTARKIRIPLLHSVATIDKLLPLATSSGLNFTIYLEDFKNALMSATADVPESGSGASLVAAVVNAAVDYKILNPRLVFYVTELSPETEALLQQSVQPIGFNMNFTGLACTQGKKNVTTEGSAGTTISQLGFRYSSLNKITLLQRNPTSALNVTQSQNNRGWFGLTELSFFINGTRYPQQKMVGSAENFGEFLTETFLSNNVLANIYHNSSLNNTAQLTAIASAEADTNSAANIKIRIDSTANALRQQIPANSRNYESREGVLAGGFYTTGATLDTFNSATPGAANYGTFLVSYSFENFKTPADDSGLYSGTSTLGSTVTAEMVHTSATTADLFFFAECDKILSIDALTQNFVVSD